MSRTQRRTQALRSAQWMAIAAGGLFAGSAAAFGLGDVGHQSALGQPLDVDIELMLDGDEDADAVQARLADASSYERAGLQRGDALANVSARVVERNGRNWVRVASQQRVFEPVLPLLIEISYRGTTVRRTYDLLLDPALPAYAAERERSESASRDTALSGLTSKLSESLSDLPTSRRSHESRRESHEARTERPAATPDRAGNTIVTHRESPLVAEPAPVETPQPVAPAVPEGYAEVRFLYPLQGPMAAATATRRPVLQLSPVLLSLPDAAAVAAPTPRPAAANAESDRAAPPAGGLLPWWDSFPALVVWLGLLVAGSFAYLLGREERRREATGETEPGSPFLATMAGAAAGFAPASATAAHVPLSTLNPAPATTSVTAAELPPVPAAAPKPAPEVKSEFARDQFNLYSSPMQVEEPVFSGSDFFSNVAEFLTQTLQHEPQRRDLRMKLLEVHYASGRVEDFLDQARNYLKVVEPAHDDIHWPEIARMGLELSPDNALFLNPRRKGERVLLEAPPEGIEARRNKVNTAPLPVIELPGEEPTAETPPATPPEKPVAPPTLRSAATAEFTAADFASADFTADDFAATDFITPQATAPTPEPAEAPALRRRFYEGLDRSLLDTHLNRLAKAYDEAAIDPEFQKAFRRDLRELMRRPSELRQVPKFSTRNGGATIYLKREDLHGTQDRKLINAIGQVALAAHMGCTEVLAGTLYTGNHAVATATIAAKKGLRCTIYASESTLDSATTKLQVLKELGAGVNLLMPGGEEPDPRRAAMRAWLENPEQSLFIGGLSNGPPPYPRIVLDLQTVVGQEVRRQLAAEKTRRRADAVVAGHEGGYETFGLFGPYLGAKSTQLFSATPKDAPRAEEANAVNGNRWRLLDRERAWLRDTGRVSEQDTSYEAALEAVDTLARCDGIEIAIEDGYALACAAQIAANLPPDRTVVALLGAARS